MQHEQIAATFAAYLTITDGWHHGNNCALGTCEPCAWVKELSRHGEQPLSLEDIIERANRRVTRRAELALGLSIGTFKEE